ncbi:CocE/NonD family hydrolase [Nocardia cyriacigeorgica]|uniref:CocE/NonD family hydrolase n=1 Tax=Nocardia cyriacigeorgica TaxID=135487 RepID=UPI00245904F7|nr:CocE/NonD family hydrolase [Nocardia cyriacigeorgica]
MLRKAWRFCLRGAVVVLPAVMIAGMVSAPPVAAVPDGGPAAARWLADYEAAPKYPAVHIDWDVPITMSDGTVLKANVYRPADANGPVSEPLPTVVNITPYTKLMQNLIDSAIATPVLYDVLVRLAKMVDLSAFGFQGLSDLLQTVPAGMGRIFAGVDRKLIQSGYTMVVVDARGTGFSQGVWDVFGPREQKDAAEIVDWAGAQPWSTGKVGMTGVSYCAINQLHAAQQGPESLAAIFPVDPGNDLLHDIANTGGAFGAGFLAPWLANVNMTKLLPDLVSIFSGKFDWKWFDDRVTSPLVMIDALFGYLLSLNPEMMPQSTKDLMTADAPRYQAWLGGVDKIEVPTFMVGSWYDLFAYSEVKAFNNIPLPPEQKKLLMGDGYHGTPLGRNGEPGTPPRLDVLQRAWFDKWLKGIDNGIDDYDPYTLFQQGGGWTSTDRFPRPEADYRRMYLSPVSSGTTVTSVHDGSLTTDVPDGVHRLTVPPGLTTICSRDAAQITAGITSVLDICTRDSRLAEINALTFTSAPVAEPTVISGPLAVHLNTVHDTADGFWTVSVNDVAPDGRSYAISSGQLVSSLRKIDDARSTRSANGDYVDPYPTLTLADRQPTVPGEPTVLDISLRATDAVLQPGHRLRVDIFASNFPRSVPMGPTLVDSRLAPQHVQLDPSAPSWVNIPMSRTAGW